MEVDLQFPGADSRLRITAYRMGLRHILRRGPLSAVTIRLEAAVVKRVP